jgi:hypothetical protein
MSLVPRLPREMHLCGSSSNVPRLPSFLEMPQNLHVLLTFGRVHNPLRLPRETTSERPKVLRTPQFFALLTSKCASCHNGVHFFDISTSKSGPNMMCFVHFDLEMCFAPQRRALYDIAASKSAPNPSVFYTFDFDMCFAQQRRAIFHLSSGQMAPHPPLWRAYFSTLRSHKSLEKHSVSRLSYLFAHLHLLSLTLSLLSSSLFYSSLLSDSSHLCFSSVHIVGSLTSKLPSATQSLTSRICT